MLISQQALLSYSCDQMFDLVIDVERYPEFLPYCNGAEILRREEDFVEARLNLARGPVHQSFATRNRFVAGQRIELELLEGPFSRLSGLWSFDPVGQSGCRVRLQLDFELRGPLKYLVTPLVTEVANRMLQSMIKRAEQIYPRGAGNANSC